MKAIRVIAFSVVAAVIGSSAYASPMSQAAIALKRAVGSRTVLCEGKGKYSPVPMRFSSKRDSNDEMTIALAIDWDGVPSSGETGHYVAYVQSGKLYLDIGDDSPHDIVRFSLADLKKLGTGVVLTVTAQFYFDDEGPRNLTEVLSCRLK